MGKYNAKIANYIYDNYVYERDLVEHEQTLKNLDLLVDNKKATKIEIYIDRFFEPVSTYNVICKFLMKRDKSLYDYKTVEDESRGKSKRTVMDDYIKEFKGYDLESGTYYIHLGDKTKDEYAVFHVQADKDDDYCLQATLYFIGNKCYKYHKKMIKQLAEFKKHVKELRRSMRSRICYDFGRGEDIRFKPFDFMVFEGKDELIKSVDNWLDNLDEYEKFKIIPRLTILLYGLPGTGKSTFYKALAEKLDIDTVISLSPEYFVDLYSGEQSNTKRYAEGIICIDDIDCICKSREDENDNRENSAVMHNLLSFLDNPPTVTLEYNGKSYEVAIVVATTNYYDKLDGAVKRYGRFDKKVEMNYFDKKLAGEFCKIYDLKLEDVIPKKRLPLKDDFTIAPAELEALCIGNIDKAIKG